MNDAVVLVVRVVILKPAQGVKGQDVAIAGPRLGALNNSKLEIRDAGRVLFPSDRRAMFAALLRVRRIARPPGELARLGFRVCAKSDVGS